MLPETAAVAGGTHEPWDVASAWFVCLVSAHHLTLCQFERDRRGLHVQYSAMSASGGTMWPRLIFFVIQMRVLRDV